MHAYHNNGGRGAVPMFRIVLILLGSLAYGAEGCAVEVKVLIAPSDQTRAVQTLGFENKQQGRVYFYDTADLDLLKQGLILRVRQGDEDNDLTVKVRPPSDSSVITDPEILLTDKFDCWVVKVSGIWMIARSFRTTDFAHCPAPGQVKPPVSSVRAE